MILNLMAVALLSVAQVASAAADQVGDEHRAAEEILAFAGVKPGDKIADFMPDHEYFTALVCKAVGDGGHVYAISVDELTATSTPPLVHACTNVTAITLKARNYPAPELHSDSDDPGWVYEYWQTRLPAESFVAPEPLDVIWAERYRDLHSKRFGTPNMHLVNAALLKALKPGGILIIEDQRLDARQSKKEIMAAGFELADEHATHDKPARLLLKFRKP